MEFELMMRHPMPYPISPPEFPMSLVVHDLAAKEEETHSPDEVPDAL